MKTKVLNGILLLTSLIGYFEWPGSNHIFIFQAEVEIFFKLITEPKSVAHPFILIPIIGQVLLVISLFQKKPHKLLSYIAIGCLGILMTLTFLAGLASLNLKILFSTIPFLACSIYIIQYHRKTKAINNL